MCNALINVRPHPISQTQRGLTNLGINGLCIGQSSQLATLSNPSSNSHHTQLCLRLLIGTPPPINMRFDHHHFTKVHQTHVTNYLTLCLLYTFLKDYISNAENEFTRQSQLASYLFKLLKQNVIINIPRVGAIFTVKFTVQVK